MKRLPGILAIVLLSATFALTYTGSARAAGKGNGGSGHAHHSSGKSGHDYHHDRDRGYSYRHRDYHGWTRYCWFADYGCYGYYCPEDAVWYYWYGPRNCYLPVSEMAVYVPVSSVNPPPALPPGATAVP